MLLQQIVGKLDGELVRLKSLRRVVEGLAKPPAGRRTALQIEQFLAREATAAKVEIPVAEVAVPLAVVMDERLDSAAETRRARHRRKASVPPELREVPAKVSRRSRPAEPTALGKAASVGPVVMSAAALLREREAREAAKSATQPQGTREAEPEIRPEAYARELAARWLSSPGKA